MKQHFIDIVKLMESPTITGSAWYVVEGKQGRYHISALGGRAAKGLPKGAQVKLYRNEGKQMSAYVLTRA